MRARGLVIAIDGPSGAGKSTAGRALAAWLGYLYIDTGAMYRALALKALRTGVPLDGEEALADLSRSSRIELAVRGGGVLLDGKDVTSEIRAPEVSGAASRVSVHAAVRAEMVKRQRELGRGGGVVLDGRDIGTVVFPDAEVKFYLDADPALRARRRHAELARAGVDVPLGTVEREVRARDDTDRNRTVSPLIAAPDALYLDTSRLSPREVLEEMRAKLPPLPPPGQPPPR